MNIIDFFLDEELLGEQQASLSDTIRMALYQADEELFGLLDYDDDFTFLEPSLFCYFLSKINTEDKISLQQSLLGYIPQENHPATIQLKADKFGIVNLPNLGHLRANPNQMIDIETKALLDKIEPIQYLGNTKIRLNIHLTDLLGLETGTLFDESPEDSFQKNKKNLLEAVEMFRKQMPAYWQIIENLTRELVIFSSPNHNSFAGIMHHGTAYINVENKVQSPVFFVEDLAHQCGHIVYNALTLDTEKYLKIPKESPLAQFTNDTDEARDVHGAFHGLYTYIGILYSLDKILELPLDNTLRHEAMGRIGFYLPRFNYDVALMLNEAILSPDGMEFATQFKTCLLTMNKKYAKEISRYNYDNQSHIFQYDLFQEFNPI